MTSKKTSNQNFRPKLAIVLTVLSLIAIFTGLIGAYNIYENNKTDGHSNGQITVTSCKEKDWAWRIYSCTGNYFSTGGGMVERSDVTVTAFTREYKQDDIITDVYAPAFSTNQTTDHFVTGRERASVTYNAYWILLVVIGIILPIITILVLTLGKSRSLQSSDSNE